MDSRVLRSSAYPKHTIVRSESADEFGPGSTLTVTHTGLAGTPDLVCTLRLLQNQSWAEIEVKVRNTTDRAITVQSIRSVHATDAPVIRLNGPDSADRILSDSFSEDRPQLTIRDLGHAPKGMHRAVGSQLIFNRQSGESLFLGALTSDRLLTIFHLQERAGADATILSYEAVATGTTEILKGESLKDSPASEQVDLSVRLDPGESLSSERLMFAVGRDYHAQLEQYGRAVGLLHKSRVKRRDTHRVVELDRLLLWAQSGNRCDERVLARREPEADGVHLLSYRRGLPICARRIHDPRRQALSLRHRVHRGSGASRRPYVRTMDGSL